MITQKIYIYLPILNFFLGAMPNSLSFNDVKELFGQHYAVHCMETNIDDKGVKDHTFLLVEDKVSFS